MEASDFQRWSVACDGFAFVGKCVYKHLTKPAIVWDIESVLDGLRMRGEKRTSKDWRRWFARLLCSDEFFPGERHYKFRSRDTPTSELANVCTTLALSLIHIDAADEEDSVASGGPRVIKKKDQRHTDHVLHLLHAVNSSAAE